MAFVQDDEWDKAVIDLLCDRRHRLVDFLGRPASTSTLLARLSLASGAPVLPVFAYWQGDEVRALVGSAIEACGPGSPAQGACGRAAKIEALTVAYSREVEIALRRFPQQWNWAHRRWKTRPEKNGDGP